MASSPTSAPREHWPQLDPLEVDLLKETFDRALALLGLLAASPLFGATTLAIWVGGMLWAEDRGPTFHRETRISAGQPFSLLKFRTMRVSAIQIAQKQGLTVKYLERANRGHTRVGFHIRRWYLDELPQLIAILQGKMSFVGPRPPAPFEYHREIAEGNLRKSLTRAGLAGLQQAHKGQTRTFEQEIMLDYEYIARAGTLRPWRRLLYDVGLLFRTMRVLLEGKGL